MDKELKEYLTGFKNDINTRFDEVQFELHSLKDGQEKLENRLESLENGQDKILKYIHEVDAKHATNHLEIINRLTTIETNLDFIEHKEHQNEKDVYYIKKKIELVK